MNNITLPYQKNRILRSFKYQLSAWVLVSCIILNFIAFIPSINLLSVEGRDFSQDYIAAKRLLNNSDIYFPFTKEEIAEIGINPTTNTNENFHPPTTLLFVLPLVLLSFKYAVYIWSFTSIVFFVSSIFLICKKLNYPKLFLLSFLSFLWFPFWLNIRFGQFSTIILFLLVLIWVSIRGNKNIAHGLLISLAILVKIFPAFILLWSFYNKKWKTIIVAALSGCPIIILIYFWRPKSILDFYWIAQKDTLLFRAYYGNFSINGIIGRIFIGYNQVRPFLYSESMYSFLLTSFTLAILLLTLLYLIKVHDAEKQFSVIIISMLLLSPITWAHSWTILLLPGFILLKSTSQYKSGLYKYGLLLFFILSCFPHWQFLTYLETKLIMPLPSWISLTALDMYSSLILFSLFFIEMIYKPS